MAKTNVTGLRYLSDRQLDRLYQFINAEFLRIHGWLVAARNERARRGA